MHPAIVLIQDDCHTLSLNSLMPMPLPYNLGQFLRPPNMLMPKMAIGVEFHIRHIPASAFRRLLQLPAQGGRDDVIVVRMQDQNRTRDPESGFINWRDRALSLGNALIRAHIESAIAHRIDEDRVKPRDPSKRLYTIPPSSHCFPPTILKG